MQSLTLCICAALAAGSFSIIQNNSTESKYPETGQDFKTANAIPDSIKEMGKKVFYTSCNACHKDSVTTLAPGYAVLTSMTPRAILASMNNGKMRQQAINLSEQERSAVAQWLTNTALKENKFPNDAYTAFSISSKPALYDHSGWGNDKEGTGFRTGEQAGITAANIQSLQLKWAFAFPDATIVRSKPAVADHWLITGNQFGDVYAIDQETGKLGWHFEASAAIRGAIAIQRKGNSITAFFADFSTNVYALDVKTGKQLWNARAGFESLSATTGSVAVHDGKIFVPITSVEVSAALNGDYECCRSSGGVAALDAATGKILWQYRILPKAAVSGKKKNGKPFYGPSGAPVWCSPTVDAKRGLLYIGTGENYSYPATQTADAIQAINMKTGKLVWNFQGTKNDIYNLACPFFNNCPDTAGPDLDFGMAPILVKKKDGKDILVAGQKSGMVHAINPDNGNLIWQTRIGKGGALGGIHWGMATDGNYVYATNADNMIAIDRSDSSVQSSPGVYALDITTGEIVWKTLHPASRNSYAQCNSAAPLVIPGIVFAGSLDGHIRAYASTDGKIIWDYDTGKEFETVNGIKGKGGAIDGPAPVVANGMLFVNSGYGMFGQMAGNVLLAFKVENKN